MMQNKKIIGITGGSGSGKSHISSMLRNRGIPVIDADITAHEVMEEDEDCIKDLSSYFGADIYENGKLNRKKLGEMVFSDAEKLKKLNEISHKYILRSINNKIGKEKSNIVCVDGAVLIESGMKCDIMIGVLADYHVRKKRIMSRDSISGEQAEMRLSSQQKDDFYKKHCDFTLQNNGGEPDIDYILKRIAE